MRLSILLPTYNDSCVALATELSRQMALLDAEAELIVADDCSTDAAKRAENGTIEQLPGCRVVWAEQNMGRAAIRNRLADEARGEWLLFIDGDLHVNDASFLQRYLTAMTADASVVVGGYRIQGDASALCHNLRYHVERAAEAKKTIQGRQRHPYSHFHTANFAIRSEVFHSIRFNDEMRRYGFEDVLFGRQLQQAGIPILHIDNPVLFDEFESNEAFLQKTDQSIQTQHDFAALIGNSSRLLPMYGRLQRLHVAWMLGVCRTLVGPTVRRRLISGRDGNTLFQLYKLMKLHEIVANSHTFNIG